MDVYYQYRQEGICLKEQKSETKEMEREAGRKAGDFWEWCWRVCL